MYERRCALDGNARGEGVLGRKTEISKGGAGYFGNLDQGRVSGAPVAPESKQKAMSAIETLNKPPG